MNELLRKNTRGTFRALVAVCASALLLYPPVAWTNDSTPVGQIAAVGEAEINGVTAVRGGTVFSGDRIETDHGSSASLSLLGGRETVLSAGSSFRIAQAGGQIRGTLDHGEVAVLSPAGGPVVVDAGGTRIVPGRAGSVYAVQLIGNKLNVSSSRGDVSVVAPNRTVQVAQGTTLEAELVPVPAQGPSGAAIPAVKSGHLEVILIVAAVALAATTLTLLVRDLNTGCKVVSPSSVGSCTVTH